MGQESPASADQKRYHVIDLLRFAAAMLVVFYHFTASGSNARYSLVGPKDLFPELEPVTRYGFLGVEMFFLISGFVILSSALGRTAVQFSISRFSRIYPTFWAGLAFSFVSLAFFLGPRFDLGARDFLANATLLQVVMRIPHVDPVYWTLWVELQFYAWILVLILLGVVHRVHVWIPIWLAITVMYAITGHPSKMVLLINPEYSSLFIAGSVFYLAARDGYRPFHVIMLAISWAVSMRFAFPHAAVYIDNTSLRDGMISAGLITLFYVIFLLISLHKLRIRGSHLAALLGGLTFPLYVLHHDFGRHAINALHPALPPYLILAVVLGVSVSMAYLVYAIVDKRLAVRLRNRLTRLSMRWQQRATPAQTES